jgi:catechol 2,3-dioxygenase-like lactoylglutathione lyase family enzyme
VLDHLTLTVRDLARSRAFYTRALAPLGYSVRMEFEQIIGFGDSAKPYFWLKQGDPPTQPMHIAFMAIGRPAVEAFHAAALEAGAADNGPPGLRERYHPSYYAAFVFDPDGHPIEAVCHAGSGGTATLDERGRAPVRGGGRTARKPASKTARKPARKGAARAPRKGSRRR